MQKSELLKLFLNQHTPACEDRDGKRISLTDSERHAGRSHASHGRHATRVSTPAGRVFSALADASLGWQIPVYKYIVADEAML
jgi:hypothetical protein